MLHEEMTVPNHSLQSLMLASYARNTVCSRAVHGWTRWSYLRGSLPSRKTKTSCIFQNKHTRMFLTSTCSINYRFHENKAQGQINLSTVLIHSDKYYYLHVINFQLMITPSRNCPNTPLPGYCSHVRRKRQYDTLREALFVYVPHHLTQFLFCMVLLASLADYFKNAVL